MSEACPETLHGQPDGLPSALEAQLKNHHIVTRTVVRNDFLRYVDVKGKRILEVGSDTQFSVASLLVTYGAEEVVCSNPFEPPQVDIPSRKIKYLRKSTEEIDYPAGYFDIVFGISVLEHIADLEAFFQSLSVLLKPDGLVWLEGSYFWTTPHGHHLWVYDEPEGAFYSFSDPTDPVRCPIKPYEHLVYSEAELAVVLGERGVRPSHVKLILDHLIRSPFINRIAPSEIKQIAQEVFEIECFDSFDESESSTEIFSRVSEKHSRSDLSLLKFVMYGVLPNFHKQIEGKSIRDYCRDQRQDPWSDMFAANIGAKYSSGELFSILNEIQGANYELQDTIRHLQDLAESLKQTNTALVAKNHHLDEMNRRVFDVLSTTATSIVESSSWRHTRFWHKGLNTSDLTERLGGGLDTAASVVLSLYQSVSWDLTAPARLISHFFNRRRRLR
jgi:SAM-dependent methyltransferase